MPRRLPADAFEFYFGLGVERSYQSVARKFGVSKKTVAQRAKAENWQRKIQEREQKAQESLEKKAVETIEAMRDRHLKMLKVIQSKALETLRSLPLQTAYQAVRALAVALEQERVVRGEPGDRTAIDIEAVIKREYATLLLPKGALENWDDAQSS